MSDNATSQQNQPALETPNIPQIFSKEWKPEIKIDFEAKPMKLNEETYEVDLRVTATCKLGEEVAFICEVHQAGLFLIKNVDEATLDYLLSGVAPNILFPYAREHISTLVNKATFPPLTLRPINFEAMYRSRQQEAAAAAAAKSDVANGADSEQAPQA